MSHRCPGTPGILLFLERWFDLGGYKSGAGTQSIRVCPDSKAVTHSSRTLLIGLLCVSQVCKQPLLLLPPRLHTLLSGPSSGINVLLRRTLISVGNFRW